MLLVGFVDWFVSLIPDFGLSLNTLDFSAVWESFGEKAAALNGWFPIVAVGAALGVYLTVQVVMSVWGFIVWLYHQFWGSD